MRRTSGCGVVALVLSLVGTVVVVLFGAMAVLVGGGSGSAAPGPETSAPAPTSSVPAPTGGAPESTTEPTSAPTSEPTQQTEQERRERARVLVQDNPLYDETAPERQRCADVDPARLDTSGRRAWATRTVRDCLMPMYGPVYAAAFDEGLPSPGVEVIGGAEVSTPCGTIGIGDNEAFYCPGSETIYLWSRNIDDDARAIAFSHLLLGHEFAHHLQLASGISEGRYQLAQEEERVNDLLRRSELQAECVGAQFLRAVGPDQSGFERDRFPGNVAVGSDSSTHGSGQNRVRWMGQGYTQADLYQCNTFRASAGDVS